MTAASFWSLLAPAIEMAEMSGSYGVDGEWAAVPVAVGFSLGGLFVYAADLLMSSYNIQPSNPLLGLLEKYINCKQMIFLNLIFVYM